jgi:hypothetical protein
MFFGLTVPDSPVLRMHTGEKSACRGSQSALIGVYLRVPTLPEICRWSCLCRQRVRRASSRLFLALPFDA